VACSRVNFTFNFYFKTLTKTRCIWEAITPHLSPKRASRVSQCTGLRLFMFSWPCNPAYSYKQNQLGEHFILSFIPSCIPDSHPHRIARTKYRINTVAPPDDILYGWLSDMQEHMLLRKRQSFIQNNKYQVLRKHRCFCWWWAYIRPKHVQIDKAKGKAIPLQAWTDPESSKSLRFPDFKTVGTWS